jgi:hypothetical protein
MVYPIIVAKKNAGSLATTAAVCHVAAVALVAVRICPALGAADDDTLTTVVAEFSASVLADFPVVSWLNVGQVNVPELKSPEVGVPSNGVTNPGLVANTAAPDPVSSVRAVASWSEVKDPKEAALPTEVTIPVKLALVTTVAALPTEVTPPVKLAFVTTVAAFPTEVTPPVRFAFVTTVVALPTEVTIPVRLALVASLPFSFCMACSIVSVAATVPAPDV